MSILLLKPNGFDRFFIFMGLFEPLLSLILCLTNDKAFMQSKKILTYGCATIYHETGDYQNYGSQPLIKGKSCGGSTYKSFWCMPPPTGPNSFVFTCFCQNVPMSEVGAASMRVGTPPNGKSWTHPWRVWYFKWDWLLMAYQSNGICCKRLSSHQMVAVWSKKNCRWQH